MGSFIYVLRTRMSFQSELFQILLQQQDELLSSQKITHWARTFENISSKYREGHGVFLKTREERMVYLFTRMPATYAVVSTVLQELHARSPSCLPRSLLDVGAGPGTGMWAARDFFPSLNKITLLEKDIDFMSIGKLLASHSESGLISSAAWLSCDMEKITAIEPHDFTLLSYSIGEVKEESWQRILSVLWESTEKAMIIVEPGTPRGYQRILRIRDILIGLGGYLWAPCSHQKKCPLEKNDWCHFSTRVSRTSIHRMLKSADLGYEDEKFSYLIFGKEKLQNPFLGRILRHPAMRSGHVEVTVCSSDGIGNRIFSKKDKEKYKMIKKINWGDVIS
jgi:ribosomal protein RSM22 (predicted rRNA methylase)